MQFLPNFSEFACGAPFSLPVCLTLISLAEARNYLAFFDGLLLKNLFTVKNLSFQLFLP